MTTGRSGQLTSKTGEQLVVAKLGHMDLNAAPSLVDATPYPDPSTREQQDLLVIA